ncbi:MAG: DNA polymerase I [Clostridiaceae bacterium]|jgi:DNA polymerase-1|nr:DNA polymerase I [Clostridiaceae bacterium]
MSSKLILIDGNSILNRGFYGLSGRSMLTTSTGLYTNAVFAFVNIMNKHLEEEKPDHIAVAFDLKAKTFRHEMYDGYKAQRKGMPDELAMQLPLIKEVLEAMNIPIIECEGYEADDVIGSISLKAEKENFDVLILTGDRDSFQLISEKVKVIFPSTKAGKTETNIYDQNTILEKYGVTPSQLIEVKGLMGDSSDNIPGVPGVGEKTALSLITSYKTIEGVYENIDQIKRPKLKSSLIENREQAFLSRTLGTIYRDLDCCGPLDDLKIKEANNIELLNIFRKLEFDSLIAKMDLISVNKEDLPKVSENLNISNISSRSDLIKKVPYLLKQKTIALLQLIDKEDSLSSHLVGLAVCTDEEVIFIKPNDELPESLIATELEELWNSDSIKKVGHDVKEWITYLLKYGIELKGLIFDTMIAEYLLDSLRSSYPITSLSYKYLNRTIPSMDELLGKGRSMKKYSDISSEQLSEYSTQNVKAVYDLWEMQKDVLKTNGQEDLFNNIELPLITVLADMEYHGFKIDKQRLHEYGVVLSNRIKTLEKTIFMLAGEEFNINSPKQLGNILFDKLNLPVVKKNKTGYSTDVEVLEKLYNKHDIIPCIIEYRQLAKLYATYAEGLEKVINPNTGKIHSSFNQTVTATGRISSTEPNLQNIPIRHEMGREIRKAFIPSTENAVFVDADYSQIELRVLAHITGDEALIKAFVNGEDIHTTTASLVFEVDATDVTPELRRRAKAVNFGIVYGISDFGLAKDLDITRKEAKQYIDGYLTKYPKVKVYMDEIVRIGKEQGYVETLFHRRRHLPELASKNFHQRSFGQRAAMNTPIQGTAADIIKIAMVKVYQTLKDNDLKSRLILQVHDELVVETVKEELEQVKQIVKQCMEQAAQLSAPLIADISTGNNWYEAK